MYDNVSLSGTINSVTPLCGGQLLELTNLNVIALGSSTPTNNVTLNSNGVRCLGGCVLTDLGQPNAVPGSASQSPAAGQSTFIVGVNPSNGNYQIAAFDNAAQPQAGDLCVINGAPVQRSGAGVQHDLRHDRHDFRHRRCTPARCTLPSARPPSHSPTATIRRPTSSTCSWPPKCRRPTVSA